MPRKPIDFSKTIIYKIVCKDLLVTQCYVGHTTEFIKRKNSHKSHCNNENDKAHNYYIYTFIRENGGWDNWTMIEIEKFPCLDVNEAHKQERYWIETLNAELNQIMPTRTIEEWCEENKEQRLEYQKLYRNNHINEIKEYKKENRDQILKQKKDYWDKNKNEINKKRRERSILKKQQSAKECV